MDLVETCCRVFINVPNIPVRVDQFFFSIVFCHLNLISGFRTKICYFRSEAEVEFGQVQNRSGMGIDLKD